MAQNESAPWEDFKKKEEPTKKADSPRVKKLKELSGRGFESILEMMDATSGLGRTTAAALADPFVEADLVKSEDFKNALKAFIGKGKAPDTEEYLNRAGVPEGWGRTALGFAGDVGLDPATYSPLGVVKNAKYLKYLRPYSSAWGDLGKGMYRSGLKALDFAAEEAGKAKNALSDILYREGVWGGGKAIREGVLDTASKLKNKKDALLTQAMEAGAVPDKFSAIMPGLNEAYRLMADPVTRSEGKALEKLMGDYVSTPMNILNLDKMKTNLTKKAGPSSYLADNVSSVGRSSKKAVASGFKDEIENAAERVSSGLGAQIKDVNKELGTLLDVRKAAKSMAKTDTLKLAPNQFDALATIFAAGASHDPAITAAVLGGKKLLDFGRSTTAKTGLGMGLSKSSDIIRATPGLTAIEQLMIKANEQENPKEALPWEEFSKSKKGGKTK